MSGPVTTKYTREQIQGAVDLAHKEKLFYLSCRPDAMWKELRNSKDPDIIRALVKADLEIAFPRCTLDLRNCKSIDVRFSRERRLECDSCYSINSGDIYISACPAPNVTIKNITTKNTKFCIVNDIHERGAIVIAEMQQQEEFVESHQETGTIKTDILPFRMENYARGAAFRDWGAGNNYDDTDIRSGKKIGDTVSRSTVVLGYCGYGELGTICRNDTANSLTAELVNFNECIRGDVLVTFNLGPIQGRRQSFESFKKKFHEKIKIFSQQTQEVLMIFAASNLLTAEIVKNFTTVSQKICKILEVNMESISKRLSHEDVEALLGRFKSVEEAEARAKKVVAENKEFRNRVGSKVDYLFRENKISQEVFDELKKCFDSQATKQKPMNSRSASTNRRRK